MPSKRTTKKPAVVKSPPKRRPVADDADPGDTADLAAQYSRVDQEREDGAESALPPIDEADEMTTGTVQDQLIYQGLEENRAGSGDLKRAEKARDALADRTAAASNPGSGASRRIAARTAKATKGRGGKSSKRT